MSSAVAMLGLLACCSVALADTNLAVEVTAGYTDNLQRQPNGQDEVPVSLGLTGTWTEATRHLTADVEGRVDGLAYLNGIADDEILGQVDGSMTWWPVPERFAWVVEDTYGQVASDPFSPISPENRQNTNFLSTGPDWYIPLGGRMRGYLGGRYSSAQYEVTDTDSERLLATAGLDRALSADTRLGLQASTERVEYDSTLQQDFDRQQAYFRYELQRGTQPVFSVNVGYTRLEPDGLDSTSAPLFELEMSRDVSSGVTLGLELANRFSDAGTEFAVGGLPGSGAGSDPGVIPEAGAYEERSGQVLVDFQRPRTNFSFALGVADEQYETATLDRRRYYSNLMATRRMTQRLTGVVAVDVSRNDYQSEGLEREDTDTEYRLELRRTLGQRASIALVGLYSSRSSDNPLTEYHETRGYLLFSYSLR